MRRKRRRHREHDESAFSVRRVLAIAALLILAVLGSPSHPGGRRRLPSGEPDPNCSGPASLAAGRCGSSRCRRPRPLGPGIQRIGSHLERPVGAAFRSRGAARAGAVVRGPPARGRQPANGRFRRRTDAGAAQRYAARPCELDHLARLADPAQAGNRGISSSVRETPAARRDSFPSNISDGVDAALGYVRWWIATGRKSVLSIPCTLPPTAASPSSFSARPAKVPPWRFKTAWAMPWARIVR